MNDGNFRAKFIVNPASANGSTGKLWDTLEQAIRNEIGEVDASFTTAPNHATSLARGALEDGFEMIVAVGGDGTVNEVVNGFFDSGEPVNPDAVLGVISRGTGSDFIRTMNLPKEIEGAARALKGRAVKRCDAGRFTSRGPNGEEMERYFINIADFGVGGEAVERVNNTSKAFGGFLSFLYGTLKTLWVYKGKQVKIKIDGDSEIEKAINSVVIANGQYFGGGMWIAPEAIADDGQFDIVILDDLSFLESLLNIPRLYKGTHINDPKVTCYRAKTLVAESDEDVLIDVEGEHGGMLPAKFEIIPSSINVKVGD
jgi:YegS/Rv2252/BmrU family lipid kinase